MKIIKAAKRFTNKFISNKKRCYACGTSFAKFAKFRGGKKKLPVYLRELNITGSDLDNFSCLYCKSTDRERHLLMYFDHIDFWKKFYNSKILHLAPEKKIEEKIKVSHPSEYVRGDLMPYNIEMIKIDATEIQFNDNYFDFVICNHVLEHIPNYKKAMSEIFRVLKPNGSAILQTPASRLLKRNFEDESINTEKLKLVFYGQEDHVRVFSETQFYEDLTMTGFKLNIIKNTDIFDSLTCSKFGVNIEEDLVWVIK